MWQYDPLANFEICRLLHTGYLTRGGSTIPLLRRRAIIPRYHAALFIRPHKTVEFSARKGKEGKETFVRYPPGSALRQ